MSLQAASLIVSSCTRTWSTITLYISSATNDLWPHSLHFYFLLLFLFVSHYQDSFFKRHNNLCSCSYHPEILTCVSCFASECSHMDDCVLFVFILWFLILIILCVWVSWMRTWLNVFKIMVFLCRVLQKTLSKLERVFKHVKCVNSFKKRVFVWRTVWMVWKIVSNE